MREVDLRVATYNLLPRACNTYLQSPVPVQGFTCRGVGHTLLLFGGQAKKLAVWTSLDNGAEPKVKNNCNYIESSDKAHVM